MSSSTSTSTTTSTITWINAAVYILSGVTQPLLMEEAKKAGLTNKKCQLYMFFYYIGPASAVLTLLFDNQKERNNNDDNINNRKRIKADNVDDVGGGAASSTTSSSSSPTITSTSSLSWSTLRNIACVALLDIVAQTMNYTGSTMAGPTIFAIVYSSVTVWCAIFSRCVLGRDTSSLQWIGVCLVFSGLCVTGITSVSLGPNVVRGALLVTVGSALHALMYVFSESVMNTTTTATRITTNNNNNNNNNNREEKKEKVSSVTYCAIYGSVACGGYGLWQLVYTQRHFQPLILEPMEIANTTVEQAGIILCSISFVSLIHSVTFFHTVKYCPGGATSAGVMKAFQAVLVFVATSLVFCGNIGGTEMCFTTGKLISLLIVVVGVLVFGKATELAVEEKKRNDDDVEKVGLLQNRTTSYADGDSVDSSSINNKRNRSYCALGAL